MNIEIAGVAAQDAYKLLIGSVIPRPIAWVSTQSPEGALNLAPFSFFQGVCSNPLTVIVSASRRSNGEWKDTAKNALAGGEFVVNMVNMDLAEAMNASSCDYPDGVSEFEMVGVSPAPSQLVRPPRVAQAPIAFECRLSQTVTLGPDPGVNLVMFGEVIAVYVRDDLIDHGRIDAARLQPLGRLAGNQYSKPGEIFELVRPVYQGT